MRKQSLRKALSLRGGLKGRRSNLNEIAQPVASHTKCGEATSSVARNDKAGFTLIELMIVVIIVAALAAMVVPRLAGRSEQAKIAVAKADINSNIAMALKLYELDNGSFPNTSQGMNALLSQSSAGTSSNWNGPYLEKPPIDPWGNTYQYAYPGSHNTTGYDLFSSGKDGTVGTDDDIGNWQ